MARIRDIIAKIRRPKSIGGDIRSVFSMTYSVHNRMASKYQWYDRWHQKSYANKVHVTVLGFVLIFIVSSLALAAGQFLNLPFNNTKSEAATNINITGVCKLVNRSTNCADGETVKVAVNGVLSAVTTTTATGAFTLTAIPVNGSDIVTVFVNNVSGGGDVPDANEANAVAKVAASPAAITGVLLYERHLTIGASTNLTLTNTDLGQYDNSVSGNENIFFEVNASNNLLVPQTGTSDSTVNQVLYIVTANTYQPASAGGVTVTTPNIIIGGTGVLTADSNTITLVGAGTVFTITGTFNANTSTVNYTCITGAETVAGTTYYNLGVGTTSDVAAAITYTLASATTVNNTLTIGNAGSTNTDIFSASTFVLTLAASSTTAWNVTAKGSIATTNSTINYTATSATTVRSMTYYALGVGTTLDSSAVVYTLGGATTVTNVITIGNAGSGANDTLNGSSYTLTVSYTGNPFTVTAHGLFDGSSGTVEYAGNVAMTVSALTYYNLTIDPTLTAARAYTGAGAITATGAFMFNPTASSAYVLTLTLGGTLSVTGTTTITKASNATSVLDTKAANSYALTTGVLTINAGGTLIGNGSTITDSGTFTNAGTYTGTSANSLLVTGNFTNSGTISSIGLVTLNKQSDASATITSGGAMLPSLTINATGSTYTLQDNLTVLGNLTLTAGTFDVSSNNRTLNLGGIWNNAGGTLNARAGSVNITGANGASSTITTNAQSFYNLSTTATADGFSKLLMHDEGANGSTTFTDSSLSNTTLTAAGGAQIATAQHQFGSSAAAFDGVATSMITAPTNDTDFDFGSGDFTIETWVKTNGGTGYEGLLSLTVANGGSFANNSFYFCVNAAGGIDIAITAGASWNVNMSSAGVTVRDGTWHHVAVTRYNGKFDTWIDGTSRANVTPTAFSINAAANRHLFVGRHPEQATLKGWMDETRISKGHARYTTTFTPTTTGFVIPTASLSSNTTATGTLTISAGTFTSGSNNLILAGYSQTAGTFTAPAAGKTFSDSGNFSNAAGGTFLDNSGTLTLNGGAGQAFTAGGTDASHDFTNLIVTNSIAAGVTFNDSVTVTGTFTDTTGPSYLYFHAGSTFTFANISISGGAVGTRVLMHSTSNGTPWIFAVANGTPVVTYVDAEDSDARTSAGPIDATTGCLDSTGNQNWTFLAAHNINVTGSLYTSDLTNSVKVPSKPLGVSVNGGAVTTGSTDINGDYSLPITISDGQMLAIFIKGDASKGSIVFKVNTTTTDITGVAFNVGYVKLNYLTGTSITNTMLDTADSSGDADLKFSVSGTTATFATGVSMYVKAARNYVPAGNVIADGVTIYGTLNLENNSMTDHGSWDATGGTFSCSGSSTVTFDSSSTGKTILTNGSNFDNVTFNNASGGWSFSDAVILNGDMTITAGALIGTNNITVNGGDVTGNGSIALTGGIFLVDGVGNFGGTTNWTFYNLTFGDGSGIATTTKTSSNIIQADSVLIIAVNQTLDASNSTWRIAGNGTPFVATGTFLQNTSTFVYSGTTANITGSTYYNLNINKVGGTETIAGSTTVQNVLNIINGTLDGSNQTLILSGSGTPLVISGTFTPSTSTVSYTGSAATNIANVTYYNLQTSNGGAGGIDSNTKVMLHYNGTNNSTIITDSAPTPNTFTSTAINSTAQYKFGTASGYFSGSTFIYAEDNNDLDFGTGNFTMDAWIRPATVAGANRIFSKGNVETTEGTYCLGYGTAWGGGTKLNFAYRNPGEGITDLTSSAITLTLDTWAHIAVVRSGSTLYYFVNGAAAGTSAITANLSSAYRATIGARYSGGSFPQTTVSEYMTGYMDELRVETSAVWTSAFTAPTAEYTAGAYSLGADLSVTNNFTESSGSFDSGSYAVAVGGIFAQSGGTFTAPGAAKTFSVGGNFNRTGGTFTNSSGTLTLNGTGVQTLTTGGTSLNNVTDSNTTSAVNQADATTIAGTLTTDANAVYDISGQNITLATLTNNGVFRLQGGETTTTITNMDTTHGAVWYDGTGTYTSLKLGNTYYKLRITGAGTWTINADLTVSSIFYIAAGTFNASSYTINLTGSGTPFAVDGTFQEATSTVIYTGSSATNILGTTYKNLKLNHASTTFTSSGATTVSGVLTIQAGIFDASSQTITLSGSGTPFVVTDTFTPSTSTIKYTGTSTAAVAATTYNNLEFSPAGTSTYTLASGTLNTNGNFSLGTGAGSTTVNADTNDPIVNVDGNFLISTEGVYIASASAAFSVASNFTNSKTFTDSGGTLTLDGQGLQTFTATNTTANYDFQNLIITNNSVAGVEFVDSVKVNGTFTDTTASSKVTFHSTSTYTFNAISINGGSTSTRVTLTSSTPGSAWNLTIAAASPSASNVSVKDSTANKDVDATTGGYDATGNTHWLFPVANNAPTNDTLIFINPYSSNIAVADDTIEWNFRALVTDLDGPTNLNYVELRLANLADSTQPYDSFKFRWTESTDTFSETADTQNAATLTSTSADSNASGNQWQLDFKIKFNSSFATTSTNYAAELYSLDDASASDNDNYVDIYQVQNLSLTFSVDSNTLAFGSLLPGSVLTGTTQTTVTTNYPNGYSLAASDGSDTNSALAQGGTYVADYASTITTPTAWSSGTGLGICLFSATGKNTTQWGTGTTETDSNNKYAGVPQNATTIHSKTGSPTLSDLSKIGYKLVVPDTQKTGAYSGIITYTVTGALN